MACPEILMAIAPAPEGLLVLLWRRCLAFFCMVAKVLNKSSDEKDLS
jgi:hypothetical protein